ncbi:hypothetical protein HGG71_02865 [Rhodobacteraceae bacterium R_SAG2]|nr:hypothetical protein [Rhodobacteraceae bacterium R_SAG2]
MTDKKTDSPAMPMNSWEMACSLLVGARRAIAKATEEHDAIRAANPHRTFIAEAATVADTIETLRNVASTLDWELARTARSANLSVPKRAPVAPNS